MNEKVLGAIIHISAIAIVGAIELIGTKMIMKKIKNIADIQKSSDDDQYDEI